MPSTAKGLRYPSASDSPNIPQYIQNLASDVDGALPGPWVVITTSATSYDNVLGASYANLAGMTGTVAIPAGRTLAVQFKAPAVYVNTGTAFLQLLMQGTQVDAKIASIGSGTGWFPLHMEGSLVGGAGGTNAFIAVQGYAAAGTTTASVRGGNIGPAVLRYRLL